MIKFSIVSVVRNDIDGLKKTLNSINEQNCNSYEHIIIDGNSSDETKKFALSVAGDNIFAISEPDSGIYDAMNKGLRMCRGEYVVFLNAGDTFYENNTLNSVYKKISNKKYDVFYGNSIESSGVGDLKKISKSHNEVICGMFACHQAMYFKREFLNKNDIIYNDKLRIAGDYDFVAKIYKKNGSFFKIDNWLCIFDMLGQSNTKKSLGRSENWWIQKNTLNLSYNRLIINRLRYILAAALKSKLPSIYKSVRYE